MMRSARLLLKRLDIQHLDVFHALVVDAHVRRYLMDGEIQDRAFCEAAIEISDRLFAQHGLGMFLLHEFDGQAAIGFAGIYVIESQSPEPQLIYALREAHTARGYATEAAQLLLSAARRAGLTPLLAGADTPNVASLAVLRKLGLRETHREPGAFGEIVMGRLD